MKRKQIRNKQSIHSIDCHWKKKFIVNWISLKQAFYFENRNKTIFLRQF